MIRRILLVSLGVGVFLFGCAVGLDHLSYTRLRIYVSRTPCAVWAPLPDDERGDAQTERME